MARHDKRDEGGMYRPLTDAETRHSRARHLTQTWDGPTAHSRVPRRETIAVCQFDSRPKFKDNQVDRDAYHIGVSWKKGQATP